MIELDIFYFFAYFDWWIGGNKAPWAIETDKRSLRPL